MGQHQLRPRPTSHIADGAVTVHKGPTEENIADVFTKPLTGIPFARAQQTLQGLPPA